MRRILLNVLLFIVFGALYFILESIYKGHLTHLSMFIVSGIIGVLIGKINEYFSWDMSIWIQCGIGTGIAVLFEGLSGLILNVWLGLHIWDYSNMPFCFFYNQCCLPFCVVWFVLSWVCIVLDDYIKWRFFDGEYPRYNYGFSIG